MRTWKLHAKVGQQGRYRPVFSDFAGTIQIGSYVGYSVKGEVEPPEPPSDCSFADLLRYLVQLSDDGYEVAPLPSVPM